MNRASRPRLSRISGSSYASKLLGRAGDGSTLTLDFTTGVLDPRLTFTRLSDATFINSSGLVQWAAANNFTNSTFSGSSGTTVPNWSFSQIAGSATVSLSGTALTITCTTATRARLIQNIGTSTGLFVTTQVKVTARSMAFPLNEVLAYSVNGSSSDQYKVNGVDRNSSYTGWNVGDVISLTCIPTNGAAAQAVIGIGASSAQPAGQSITITDVQAEPGTVVRSVIPTGTSGSYQAPRFDHDPTTGSPRGLLIEGAANNLARYSETLETTGGFWGYNAATRTVESSDVNPTGGTGSISFAPTTNGGSRYCGLFLSGQTTTVAYTYSVWVKAKGTSSLVVTIQNSAGAVNSNARIISQPSGANASFTGSGGGFPLINNLSATGWTRIELTTTATLGGTGTLNVFMYPNNTSTQTTTDSVFAWGAQLEAGSGASSYIPTGASTGNRVADSCVMTGTNFSSWFAGATEGVLYAEVEQPRKINSPASDHGVVSTLYTSGTWLGIQITATNQFPSSVLWPTGGFSFAGGIATRVPLVSKQAVRWFNGASITNFGNGTQGSTTVGTGSVALGLLTIGANVSSGTTANLDWLNSCVRRVKFWPTALPNATIQALTT